jgi:hypothetical protein
MAKGPWFETIYTQVADTRSGDGSREGAKPSRPKEPWFETIWVSPPDPISNIAGQVGDKAAGSLSKNPDLSQSKQTRNPWFETRYT